MSQDPVALDSVAYDFITSEPNLTRDNPSFNGNADSYLHEAALAGAPPSKAKYDPENSGKALESLGVRALEQRRGEEIRAQPSRAGR